MITSVQLMRPVVLADGRSRVVLSGEDHIIEPCDGGFAIADGDGVLVVHEANVLSHSERADKKKNKKDKEKT